MMHTIENPKTEVWFIARCEDCVTVHYGSVKPGQTMQSGQSVLETYPTREAWRERLGALGVDPDPMSAEPGD